MREFVELAKYVSGAKTQLNFGAVPYRDDEAMLCVADTNRLRSLGWRPKVSLTEGLTNLFASLRCSEAPPFSQTAISSDNQS
jgi:nucleoside-diphosphate-sugar epimerase